MTHVQATFCPVVDNGERPLVVHQVVNDRRFPNYIGLQQRLENFQDFKVRKDDILLIGYPKSGTHWVTDIILMLLSGEAIPVHNESVARVLEIQNEAVLEKMTSPRLLTSHLPCDFIPDTFFNKFKKVLYVRRDPRDVMVSNYHFLKELNVIIATWGEFFQINMDKKVPYGPWFDYTSGWEMAIKTKPTAYILHLRYELLHKDLKHWVKATAKFLDVERSDDFYEAVAQQCTFCNIKAKKNDLLPEWSFLKGLTVYRNGNIGDWKNYFTVAQSEEFKHEYDRHCIQKDRRLAHCQDVL